MNISIRKKVKHYKDSYLSLKELSSDFEHLIGRCEEEGGRLLEKLEGERTDLEDLIRELEERKKSFIPEIEPGVSAQPEKAVEYEISEESAYLEDHLQEKYVDIYRLADQGKTPKQIESLLGFPLGEIELILSLRK